VTDPLPAGIAAILNTGQISSRYGPTISDTLSVPVIANAELIVHKSDGVTRFQAGDILTYTISLANAGNQGASGIVVTDTLPAHTAFVPGSASHGGVYLPTNRQVVWTIAPPLSGKSDISRTVQVQVNDPLPEHVTQITNTITVVDDGANGDTLSGNAALDINMLEFKPAIRIGKYGPAFAEIGDTITFTFTVSTVSFTPTAARANAIGDGSPIHQVQVYDSKIGSIPFGHGDDGDGLLELGEVWVYTADYIVKLQDRGSLVNIGTVSGQDVNGDVVSDTSTHTTVVPGRTLYLPLAFKND
jgi:uncharacterized repeat protein (TIGR01451 family)